MTRRIRQDGADAVWSEVEGAPRAARSRDFGAPARAPTSTKDAILANFDALDAMARSLAKPKPPTLSVVVGTDTPSPARTTAPGLTDDGGSSEEPAPRSGTFAGDPAAAPPASRQDVLGAPDVEWERVPGRATRDLSDDDGGSDV